MLLYWLKERAALLTVGKTFILREKTMQKELVEFITKSLVDNPDSVKVREIEGEQTSVLELTVAKEDLGKVIGKQGRIAKAIRVVMRAAAIREDKKIMVEID